MIFDMHDYNNMIKKLNINIIYSGPLWDDGMKGLAETVRTRLANGEIPGSMAKNIFSVFVEQVTNMLMHSSGKAILPKTEDEPVEVSTGILILGEKDNTYFIQTCNDVTEGDMELLKSRIDHLNSLDKNELRKYHRERLALENDNPDSKGAGLGLIEIARRATAPISYRFEPTGGDLESFTMYVEIGQEK